MFLWPVNSDAISGDSKLEWYIAWCHLPKKVIYFIFLNFKTFGMDFNNLSFRKSTIQKTNKQKGAVAIKNGQLMLIRAGEFLTWGWKSRVVVLSPSDYRKQDRDETFCNNILLGEMCQWGTQHALKCLPFRPHQCRRQKEAQPIKICQGPVMLNFK